MRRRKPIGWPRYMVARRLKSSSVAYYWVVPSWAKQKGCALEIEALGTDYADAKKRCDDLLNPQLDAWRKREAFAFPSDHCVVGTFDWMVAIYKSSPLYQKLPAKTRKSYDAALRLASQHALKDHCVSGFHEPHELIVCNGPSWLRIVGDLHLIEGILPRNELRLVTPCDVPGALTHRHRKYGSADALATTRFHSARPMLRKMFASSITRPEGSSTCHYTTRTERSFGRN
jgi:hypothetical protein